MISRGATSIWERWDGIQPGGGPACPTMNSFNHYALGSMFRWAIEAVCGLAPDPGAVAFRHVLLRAGASADPGVGFVPVHQPAGADPGALGSLRPRTGGR